MPLFLAERSPARVARRVRLEERLARRVTGFTHDHRSAKLDTPIRRENTRAGEVLT